MPRPRKYERVDTICHICSAPIVRRKPEHPNKVDICGLKCLAVFNSRRFSKMNEELNPTRMTDDVKDKLRNYRLGKGEGKAYRKLNGRHVHRTIAEQKLGRPLRKGEVVHHLNENKLDNRPENIMVFASQSEHARWHADVNYLIYGTKSFKKK